MSPKALYSNFERRFPWLTGHVVKYVSNRKDGSIDIHMDSGEILFYSEQGRSWILRKGEIHGKV
jgi:hypothetical protein